MSFGVMGSPEGATRLVVRIVALHALVGRTLAVLACLCSPAAASITNDLVVLNQSRIDPIGQGVLTSSFGTTEYGDFNSTGGRDDAATAWFPDHVGMYARGSMNSTGDPQHGSGYAEGLTQESILIPEQQGIALGEAGTLVLNYHLDGTVNIDVGVTLDTQGQLVSGGGADLLWEFAKREIGTDPYLIEVTHDQKAWRGNLVSDVVNDDVTVNVPFHYGVPFYYFNRFKLSANAMSLLAPSVGFSEADFLHTGMFLGGTVLDSFGTALTNPVVMSDSEFEYVNTPEPGSVLLSSVGLLLLSLRRLSRR